MKSLNSQTVIETGASRRTEATKVRGFIDEEASVQIAESGFAWARYAHILVALDQTPAAAFALRHAVPYAVDQRSQLTLLTVVPNPRFVCPVPGFSPQSLAEEMKQAAAARLRVR